MKIAMMTYTMARGRKKGEAFDVEGLCRFTRELGLEGVDWVTTYEHDPREVRRIMDDHGLRTVCYTFFCDLNFPTAAERRPGLDTFRRGIEAAVALGADKVMLPVSGKSGCTREESFRNVVQGLHEAVILAEEAGVTTTVENFPHPLSPFIVSDDVNRAIREVPQLRVTFDNGNVVTGGESAADGFRKSAPYVVHAHFKDFQSCPEGTPGAHICLDGKYRRAVLVGDGDVDQVACVQAMREHGYQGYINFEYEGSDLSPRDATIEGVRRMREWIAQSSS
ncbi:MAG: sugar phosphate isomerase/epimerase [Armatimonadetes bacterium]|nr:sugar phosphate isomerase/epimerase [Armatimonadota bacterium]